MVLTTLNCIQSLIEKAFYNDENIKTSPSELTKLFNILSIYSLLKNYQNRNIDLTTFIKDGTYKEKFTDRIAVPPEDMRVNGALTEDGSKYIELIVNALKDDHYTFSDQGEVMISSKEVETSLPSEWLFRLSEIYKVKKYEKIFFYNKKSDFVIGDENSLREYLYQTKTFLVTLRSSEEKPDFDLAFKTAGIKTENEIDPEKNTKVDDIIKKFVNNIPTGYTTDIKKYRLSNSLWLLSKANKLGITFYNATLEEQQEYMSNWFVERLNNNVLATEETQKFLLNEMTEQKLIDDYDKNKIITGLFMIYLKVISKIDIDYYNVSISNFRIENYMNENLQNNLLHQTFIIEEQKKIENNKDKLSKEYNDIKNDLKESSYNSNANKKYADVLKDYMDMEVRESITKTLRVDVQNKINNEKEKSTNEIAFNNDRIMELICQAVDEGCIYITKSNELSIEIHNSRIGRTTFKVSTKISDLLEFIYNLNENIKENEIR